jgi:hypothetical protein
MVCSTARLLPRCAPYRLTSPLRLYPVHHPHVPPPALASTALFTAYTPSHSLMDHMDTAVPQAAGAATSGRAFGAARATNLESRSAAKTLLAWGKD